MQSRPLRVAIVHDYLTQRGGAERVTLAMLNAFPDARLVTSLYDPEATFPAFAEFPIETLPVNAFRPLRRHHKLAFPLLANAFSRFVLEDVDLVLCSSSGWSHGIGTDAPKVVYCHNPARWLYQPEDYFRGRNALEKWLSAPFRHRLRNWDQAAARSADLYLANSSAVADRIHETYEREATVLHPPATMDPKGGMDAIPGIPHGYFLCVARRRGYKHVNVVVEAAKRAGATLVTVGGTSSVASTDQNIFQLGSVTDEQLRWLYANAGYVVGAAHEDFGLTPIEGNVFGTPALVLRSGGYLETVKEGVNGLFFEELSVEALADAMSYAHETQLDPSLISWHAGRFGQKAFAASLQHHVLETARRAKGLASSPPSEELRPV